MTIDVQALIQKFISLRSSRDLLLHQPADSLSREAIHGHWQHAIGASLALYEVDVITSDQQDDISAYFGQLFEQAHKRLAEAA